MIKVIFLMLFSFSTNAVAGHEVNNGGQVLICHSSYTTLSLDYVIAKKSLVFTTKLVPASSAAASLLRISELIKHKLPELSNSFAEFVAHVKNDSDPKAPYYWVKATSRLEEINDQNVDYIPAACPGGERAELRQAIRRSRNEANLQKNQTVFHFDDNVMTSISRMQLSFLLVHEWLWDISSNVVQNRNINYFLHSELFDQVSGAEAVNKMRSYGVNLDAKN